MKVFKVLLIIIALIVLTRPVHAFPLIRDTEIEETLRLYTNPILRVAGLNPDVVGLHIINDKTLNAFVTNGQNIYVHAGLLMEADSAEQVIGVLAHEVGHISGGHIARTGDTIDKAKTAAIASMLLGAAAGFLSGEPQLAVAVVGGGQQVAQQTFLGFSRSQERSADQAATDYLDQLDYSGEGLFEFLKKLENQSLLISRNRDPYAGTHPPTDERIDFMRNYVEKSPNTSKKLPAEFYDRFNRMQAKLDGFLLEPVRTFRKYDPADETVPARYARSIAHYRVPNLDQALDGINSLIIQNPEDAYFWELKGQILFENGKIKESIKAYNTAVKLKENAPLFRIYLAQSQLAVPEENLYDQALANLRIGLKEDSRNSFAWRLQSIAYGQKGSIGMAELSLAEYFLLRKKEKEAKVKAMNAKKALEEGTPAWYRANDIIQQTTKTDS